MVASTALAMRRNGAGARARDRKPRVLVKCARSGSSSAVGDILAWAEAEEPVRVAQGLLPKVNMRHNAEITALGHSHMPIWPQRIPHIGVQRVGNNLLTADAEAGIPPRRFVEESAAITVLADGFGRAFGDVCDRHVSDTARLASAILQLFPNIEEEL